MQALSVWPSGAGFLAMPQLHIELDSSSSFLTTRRRTKSGVFADSVFQCKSHHLFMVSGSCVYAKMDAPFRSSNFDVRSAFFSMHSQFKFFLCCEPKRRSFGSSAACALKQQEIDSEIHSVESSLEDGLLGKDKTVDVYSHDLYRARNNDDVDSNEKLTVGSEEEVGEDKGSLVDVRELAFSLHSVKTADDVEEILRDKGELPPQVFSTLIRGLGWDKKMDSALALLEWLKRKKKETGGTIGPNQFIYNGVLSAVKQSEQYDLMDGILNDMHQEGFAPNVVTYNILMVTYVEKGQCTKALDILEEMHKKGLMPSSTSYSTALLAYRRMEDGNGALKFFLEMKDMYLKGEIGRDSDEDWEKEFVGLEDFTIRICYQVMRRWLVRHENLSTDVLKLLRDMDKAGLKPGREEYERLVWACTREDHYPVAKELYDTIREKFPKISLSVCNHAIWLMGKAKKWWAALEIYEDLSDKGPEPNTMTHELIVSHFNILLTAARKRGIWRWGVRLLNKMEEKGLKLGSKQWNAVLVACSKASESSAAVQIFRRMVDQREKPTIISYGAMLSALEKDKLYDEAVRVWEHMLKVRVKPNSYAYTIMASVFTGKGNFKLVDAIIQQMVASGIRVTVVTFNAIISGCARNGMSGVAYEWFHRMKVFKSICLRCVSSPTHMHTRLWLQFSLEKGTLNWLMP
uniref:Pentatricopeptide repeat-containing protein n=1 Tax=Rhizophora mucronata TaxID=61149 RepID=A0A2P2IUW5_RHIMU